MIPQTQSSVTITTTISPSLVTFARLAVGIGPKEVLLGMFLLEVDAGKAKTLVFQHLWENQVLLR